jgi:hypothetical protein
MRTNADCTIYFKSVDPTTRSEEYTPVQVRGITWQGQVGARVIAPGVISEDKATIFIPLERGSLALAPGHVIVKGLVYDEIGPAFTITDLKAKYPGDVLTIRAVAKHDFGAPAMQHWEIGAT